MCKLLACWQAANLSRSLKSSKLQKTSKGEPWTIPPHPPYNGDLERKSTGCVYIYYILQSGFHIIYTNSGHLALRSMLHCSKGRG